MSKQRRRGTERAGTSKLLRFTLVALLTAAVAVVIAACGGGGSDSSSSSGGESTASEGGDTLIRYGQSVNGTLTDAVYARFYQFTAAQDDQITVSVETLTGDLDPYVVLRDDIDTNLTSNDDADSSTRNARLTYTIPEDGLYIIAVTRFGLRDGTTTGDFKLTLERNTEEEDVD